MLQSLCLASIALLVVPLEWPARSLTHAPFCLPLFLPPVGAVSLLIGLLNLLFAVDPRFKLEEPQYRQDRQKE